MNLKFKNLVRVSFRCRGIALGHSVSTVNPALVSTCLPVQRPHFFPLGKKNGFSLKHILKEPLYKHPPLYKDHFLCFPWAAAIVRFDCLYIYTYIYQKKSLFLVFLYTGTPFFISLFSY